MNHCLYRFEEKYVKRLLEHDSKISKWFLHSFCEKLIL